MANDLDKLLSELDCDHIEDFLGLIKKRMESFVQTTQLTEHPEYPQMKASFRSTPYYPYYEKFAANRENLLQTSESYLKHSSAKPNENKRLSN